MNHNVDFSLVITQQEIIKHGPSLDKTLKRYVLGYCAVRHYDLIALKNTLSNSGIHASFLDDKEHILHFNLLEFHLYHDFQRNKERLNEISKVHSFVLENGVFVCWGLMNELHLTDKEAVEFMIKEAHSPILEFLDRFSNGIWPPSWSRIDILPYYHILPLSHQNVSNFSINAKNNFEFQKQVRDELLAASLAFGTSCRLCVYENAVDHAILKFDALPSQLASNKFDQHFIYGSSQIRKIRQWVGEIYAITVVINIAEDFLDVPEYFWHHDIYQPVWQRIHQYFQLDNRIKVLNLRLKCLKDVLKTIARRRVSAQSHYLSFCVIVLLVIGLLLLVLEEYIDISKFFS
ncbi:uncharacterized protein LOC128883400 isoform X2 [Hylaeus volcanicus]|uniref:uncharacterized protein LOC128883400 isoform X2 n=1 Tax=Hylaeus volcanicus TaxID=313075 RepID=UPI0023B7FACD|nr:uncharacterized protein LOC128883400 isoform X2 [Hylaeus volcanicus]